MGTGMLRSRQSRSDSGTRPRQIVSISLSKTGSLAWYRCIIGLVIMHFVRVSRRWRKGSERVRLSLGREVRIVHCIYSLLLSTVKQRMVELDG